MSNIYALINPDTSLDFRGGLPDLMLRGADPHHGMTSEFTIQRESLARNGMHGFFAHAAGLGRDKYPPNHVAGPLIAALGGPDRYWFGSLTICGCRPVAATGRAELCGLSMAQQRLIAQVHATVLAGA
ncbi:hypothetical protein AB0C96_35110 [Streptomyces sp. NPDC048506]|uniref:hypothetical protein n=1 Tax=Streptomyces sp. NPDC048506 TaxID=3155028 RepID=UPI00342B0362